VIAQKYKFELPNAMQAAGYRTAVVGKDHFGWNKTTNKPISHGYQFLKIYDGLGNALSRSSFVQNDSVSQHSLNMK
jgi:arylsulfatase A-like enzyme